MATSPLGKAVRNTLLRLQGADRPGDAQLLERFAVSHDDAAFEELVRRHGPMVMRLCRRLLRGDTDVEDAYQASFVVLARRAATVRKAESVASWLYKVTHRVALKARTRAGRRQSFERPLGETAANLAGAPGTASPESDLRPILDEELRHLPERYRAPLVLCYLESRSVDEAAAELGAARGTVASRMSRGREMLRNRLAKRGLALSAAALTAQLESTAGAAIPVATLHTLIPAGFVSGTGIREGAAVLARQALQSMFWSKVRWTGALLACLLIFGTATVKWTASSGKSAANANVNARQGDDFYVRWRFDYGPPKDIRVFEGNWEYHPGKPGVMLAPGTMMGLVLPTPIPRRPFLLSVKYSERRLPPPPRIGDAESWSIGVVAFWANERGECVDKVGYKDWMNEELKKPGSVQPGDRLEWYWVDCWCIMVTPRAPSRICKYAKPYPSQTVALRLKNFPVEEIELRSLRRGESRKVDQIIKRLGKTPGWKSGPR